MIMILNNSKLYINNHLNDEIIKNIIIKNRYVGYLPIIYNTISVFEEIDIKSCGRVQLQPNGFYFLNTFIINEMRLHFIAHKIDSDNYYQYYIGIVPKLFKMNIFPLFYDNEVKDFYININQELNKEFVGNFEYEGTTLENGFNLLDESVKNRNLPIFDFIKHIPIDNNYKKYEGIN